MKESVVVLLKKAENDLKDAKILYNSNEASAEGICFHCQQAVEKFLKTYLVYNNKEINKTHDISELLQACKNIDNAFSELERLNIDDITNYAVIVRYDDIIEPSKKDAEEAIAIAEYVKLFALKKINIK
ncbi:MAG: HEPN domain-containing protein [Deltaproteobacteria bacterium]|jgi:HEPN domain-containing protein|uniref:HEPN domain-containing protein n=1 Tax=Candidatus Acidulodesulfobacterium acidiphilum TaxID=2597224 RepID=A0A520XGU8_9DELT|nr:HEPN domain-containing protein [Deltaproteobacteria bacterium]MDA8299496.1 HEPN domain-containing protein [Deltaproteobacteria bacterium]RZV40399.1 MAG: HEPN domain-containing protein [Candidatus Acidulodesulfobacterium acidiphilum]